MAYLSPLRTRNAWDVTAGYASKSEFGSTQYWAGAELLSSTYFLAECTEQLNSGSLQTAFITYDVEHAAKYLADGPPPTSSRILVLKRGPRAGETRLGEVNKVLRCTVTGALVIRLATGELVSDGNDPAHDSKGVHHFEVIYPRPVRSNHEVRLGPVFNWRQGKAGVGA